VPDTLYADVSEWQVGVNDESPYPVLCIRSNAGTYRDHMWANNYAWFRRNTDSGRLTFFIVYFVWRPNWQETVDTFQAQVGAPHPKMAVMIDVESWGAEFLGNQSDPVNAAYEQVGSFVGSTASRAPEVYYRPSGAAPVALTDYNAGVSTLAGATSESPP